MRFGIGRLAGAAGAAAEGGDHVVEQRAHAGVLEQHRLRAAGGAGGELHQGDARDRTGARPAAPGPERHRRRRRTTTGRPSKRSTCSGVVTIDRGLDRLEDVGEVGRAEARVERHVHAAGPPHPEQRGDDVGVRAASRPPARRRSTPASVSAVGDLRRPAPAPRPSEWSAPPACSRSASPSSSPPKRRSASEVTPSTRRPASRRRRAGPPPGRGGPTSTRARRRRPGRRR